MDTDAELQDQLSQLNIPITPSKSDEGGGKVKAKSNLAIPNPPNLPLAMLKLMDSYVIGLAEVDAAKGGWAEAKRERMLGVVKALGAHLGDAERLRHSEYLELFIVVLQVLSLPCRSSTLASHSTPITFTTDLPRCYTMLAPYGSDRSYCSYHYRHSRMVPPRSRCACWGSRRSLRTIR
jgi:hypothetical protein